MTSGITRDDWLAALQEVEHLSEADTNAVTTIEFMAMTGLKRTTAHARLNQLVEMGKATQTMKQVRDRQGRRVTVPAFCLVQQPWNLSL